MIFQRQFKFYASHRNQLLSDKCACLHGHRYEVTFQIEVQRGTQGSQHTSVLFADLDFISDRIRERFDHACLIDFHDSLLPILVNFAKVDSSGPFWKFAIFPFPTSAENLAFVTYDLILTILAESRVGVLKHITLRETDSTLIVYDQEDWDRDASKLQWIRPCWKTSTFVFNPSYEQLPQLNNWFREHWNAGIVGL